MSLRVGINDSSYFSARYTSLPFHDITIIRTHDLFNIINGVRRRLPGARDIVAIDFANCAHFDPGFARVDLMHLFNGISWSRTPWIVSFEHYLPRWNPQSLAGLRKLSGKRCRKLIAMSQWAADNQRAFLSQHETLREEIEAKMCIIQPAQLAAIDTYEDKSLDPGRVHCTFVGRDFFRKGGWEALRAFDRLIRGGYPVALTIVSSMDYGDYLTQTTEEDYRRALSLIEALHPHVVLIRSLPTSGVLELLRHSHVGLLPTYVDTYGYSVLESQAAGCPVITTNGCALPETNNDLIGWMIDLPKDELGVVRTGNKAAMQGLSDMITEGIVAVMQQICSHPEQIRQKGERALARIKEEYSPASRAEEIGAIYREAARG